MTLEEILIDLTEDTSPYKRHWDKDYVSPTGRKGIWIYDHREKLGLKPNDGFIGHHKDRNKENNNKKNLQKVDRRSHAIIDPNAKKYQDDDKCDVKGCSKKPVAKGKCWAHYIASRRKQGLQK
jgi:hypothetical protein